MVDQGNRAAAYDSLRSVLRALDEEDDATPMPAYDGTGWNHPEITPSTAVACGNERMPTSDAESGVLSRPESASEDEDWPKGRFAVALGHVGPAARKALAAITFAAPTAGLLLAGALFILPTPNGHSARTALDELRLVTESQADPVSSAEIIDAGETEFTESQRSGRGVAGFAELARKALAAMDFTIESPQPNTSEN